MPTPVSQALARSASRSPESASFSPARSLASPGNSILSLRDANLLSPERNREPVAGMRERTIVPANDTIPSGVFATVHNGSPVAKGPEEFVFGPKVHENEEAWAQRLSLEGLLFPISSQNQNAD